MLTAQANPVDAAHRSADSARYRVLWRSGNFDLYALVGQAPQAFDLMLMAICCGSTKLAHELWKYSCSPLRTALVAQGFIDQIGFQRSADCNPKDLEPLREAFRDAAIGVLVALPSVTDRRKVLLAVPEPPSRCRGKWADCGPEAPPKS